MRIKCIVWILMLIIGTKSTLVVAQTIPEEKEETIVKRQSIEKTRVHSPKKAAIYSTVLPGLGQIYNGNAKGGSVFLRYWKVPIIYTGLGLLGTSISLNNKWYKNTRNAFNSWDGTTVTIDNIEFTTEDKLREYKDFYRRNRDLSIMAIIGVYALQIVDANVDAHLMNFNINENLLISYAPELRVYDQYSTFGIRIGILPKF